jgi:hypothetical protein
MTIGPIAFDQSRLPDGVDLAVVCTAPGQRHAPPPAGIVYRYQLSRNRIVSAG